LIGFKSSEKYLVTEEDRELVRDHDNIFLIDKPILIDDGNVLYNLDNNTIKVTLSNDNEIFDNSILKFNRNRITINNTYVSDFFQKDNKNIFNVSDIQYTPMYNMIDMSIKSSYDIFYRNTEVDAEDTYTNVYAPDISSNPIQFC
jgi:hypothetical protein